MVASEGETTWETSWVLFYHYDFKKRVLVVIKFENDDDMGKVMWKNEPQLYCILILLHVRMNQAVTILCDCSHSIIIFLLNHQSLTIEVWGHLCVVCPFVVIVDRIHASSRILLTFSDSPFLNSLLHKEKAPVHFILSTMWALPEVIFFFFF